MSINTLVRDIVKKVSHFGFFPSDVIVDNETALITWSCYCVTCTVSSDGIVIRYIRTEVQKMLINEDMHVIVDHILDYISKERKFDREVYGDEVY